MLTARYEPSFGPLWCVNGRLPPTFATQGPPAGVFPYVGVQPSVSMSVGIRTALGGRSTDQDLTPAERTLNGVHGPICACSDHSHSRSIRAIDQRMRANLVIDVRNLDLRRRTPSQRLRCVAGPDAPFLHCGSCRACLIRIAISSSGDRRDEDLSPGEPSCHPMSTALTWLAIGRTDGDAEGFFRERLGRFVPRQ